MTPALLAWLAWAGDDGQVAEIVQARDAYGREKYGCGLHTHDCRDKAEDLRQEVGDALQYAMAAIMEGLELPGDVASAVRMLALLVCVEGGGDV